MKISLHYKWTGIVCFIILLISFATYITSVEQSSSEIRDELVTRGLNLARDLAVDSEYGLFVRDTETLQSLLDNVNNNEDVTVSAVYDRSGGVIAGSGEPLPDSVFESFSSGDGHFIHHRGNKRSEDIIIIVPVFTVDEKHVSTENELFSSSNTAGRSEKTIGYVAVSMNGKRSFDRIYRLRRNLAVVGLVVSLIGAVLIAVLVRRMVLPIRRLVAATRLIAEGELTQKVDVSRNDEIGDLAHAFNKMTSRLEETTVSRNLLVEEIEHRKKTEEERLRLEQDLLQSRKLEAIGTLAAGIAHEINTPVQFISDNTQFLSDALSDLFRLVDGYRQKAQNCVADCPHQDKELLRMIKEQESNTDLDFIKDEVTAAIEQTKEGLDRVSRIVSAMKDFSHVDSAQNFQDSDINRAIESTITVSRNVWKYVAEMEKDFDANLPLVHCVLSDINQVVMNLIVNAAHAIEEKNEKESLQEKGRITVSTGYDKDSDTVRISVRDTGGGIPDNIREKIFDPFFTTKKVGKGTGQGLSLAYSTIVEKHGGKIKVDSTVGQGSVFMLELPVAGTPAVK